MPDWLFSSGDCVLERDFGSFDRLQFRHGRTTAYMEEDQLLPGIALYRSEAGAHSRFGIDISGDEEGRGRMILGSILASRGVLGFEGADDQIWRDDGRFYVISPVQRRVRYEIDAERGWRLAAVKLEPEALDILGPDGLPQPVRDVLEGRRSDLVDMAPLTGALRAASHALLRSSHTGQMETIFRQAKVLELLGMQLQALGEGGGTQALGAGELARVRMARDRLLADLRDPPDLAQLARDVGLSAKRLNRGFRELYGTTVFNYLRDARLDAARAALEGGSELSLKRLAWELGYTQTSNFITAFRRRFGVSPGVYRAATPGLPSSDEEQV